MIFAITDLGFWYILLGALLASTIIYIVICIHIENKKKLVVNGVKLGDLFRVVCEMEDFKLVLDTETLFLYLISEDGITPLLDKNGKPKRYKNFGDIVRKE